MTVVDTALFQLSLQLIALRIPAKKCSTFMQRLQDEENRRKSIYGVDS